MCSKRIYGVYLYWSCLIYNDFRYFHDQYSNVSKFMHYQDYFIIRKFIYFL